MATSAQQNQQTPQWWFDYLMKKFDEDLPKNDRVTESPNMPKTRRDRLTLLWDYYIGNPPLPYISDTYKASFQEVMRKARANYATMAVDVMTDRSTLQGVSTSTDGDVDGDDVARQIMDASGFDAMHRDLQTYLFSMGEAYVMLIPSTAPGGLPIMTAEDPRNCVGVWDPMNPGKLAGAVKVFTDEINDQQVALLFLPGQMLTVRRTPGNFSESYSVDEWTFDPGSVSFTELAQFGGMPMVRFDNKMKLGEFEPHLDLLDRIMDGILQRIVIAWYQSFRQRAVRGDLDGGEDFTDESSANSLISSGDGTDLANLFQADPGSVWVVPSGVEFWESGQADMQPLLQALVNDVKEFAAATRTPLHIITPDAANQSAEGANAMREALVDKVSDRQARMSPGWILVFQLAFAMANQAQHDINLRLLWAPTQRHSLSELAAAASQLQGVLSINRICIDYFGMSPQEAKLNEIELAQQALQQDQTPAAFAQIPGYIQGTVNAAPAANASVGGEDNVAVG